MLSKEASLMNEGNAYRKRHGISRTPIRHDFGIYSIKQFAAIDEETPAAAAVPAVALPDTAAANNRVQLLLKERVRGISHKVDTMRLNDEEELQSNQLNNNCEGGRRRRSERLRWRSTWLTLRWSRGRRSRLITLEQSQQTQGDKLNQIKAMRRRPSRSANIITQCAGDPRTLAAASATVQANNLLNQLASSKLTGAASPSEVPPPAPTDTSDGVPVPPVSTSPAAATSTGSSGDAAAKGEEGVKQITATATNNLVKEATTTTSTANVAATTTGGGGGPGGGGCNMGNVMLQCPATRQNHRLFRNDEACVVDPGVDYVFENVNRIRKRTQAVGCIVAGVESPCRSGTLRLEQATPASFSCGGSLLE
ncbi:hypothetical protein pipiens_000738, partial [Culex pipiens pipiens]